MLKKILAEYALLEGVRAIGIGGSRAAASSDQTSDYDIYIFTEKEPALEDREKIARRYSSKTDLGNDFFGPGDEYFVDSMNVEFDIMYFDAAWFEGIVKSVWDDKRASNAYTTAFLYTLKNMKIEYDPSSWLEKLQKKLDTPYPQELKDNILKRSFALMKDKAFSSYLEQLQKAVDRKDLNSINHRSAAFFESYFDSLFAINGLLHPGEKRLISFALKNCSSLPEDFEEDMNRAFTCKKEYLPGLLSDMVEKLRALR